MLGLKGQPRGDMPFDEWLKVKFSKMKIDESMRTRVFNDWVLRIIKKILIIRRKNVENQTMKEMDADGRVQGVSLFLFMESRRNSGAKLRSGGGKAPVRGDGTEREGNNYY
ncbi:hypothetical protein Tco_0556302 [Tanacetum coccineum]